MLNWFTWLTMKKDSGCSLPLYEGHNVAPSLFEPQLLHELQEVLLAYTIECLGYVQLD
jgi:hypothetical protein